MNKSKSKSKESAAKLNMDMEPFLKAFSELLDEKKLATAADVLVLQETINKLIIENKLLQNEISKIKDKMEYQERVIEKLENDQLSNNLLLYGVACEEDDAVDQIQHLFKEHLGIEEDITIKSIYFPAKKLNGNNINKPIKITLKNTEDTQVILKNCQKLKGTKVGIQRDLIPSTRKRLSKIVKIKKEIRKKNTAIKTTIIRDELIVEGKRFIWKEGQGIFHIHNNNISSGQHLLQDLIKFNITNTIQRIIKDERNDT